MSKKLLSEPYLPWTAAFTIVPLVLIVYYGLTDKTGAFTMTNVIAIATTEHFKALWLSLGLSLISTVVCLLLAYPLAVILRNRGIGKGSFVAFIFILLMWMSFLLRTLAWQTLLEKGSVINGILTALHPPNQSLIGAPDAVTLGMVYSFLPFMALPIYSVLYKIDNNTIDAARGLSANFTQTLMHIWIPLNLPDIISDTTMVFVPALTTLVISNLLDGSKISLIGSIVEQKFTKGSNWHLGSDLSLVLMVFILINMALIAKYDRRGEGATF